MADFKHIPVGQVGVDESRKLLGLGQDATLNEIRVGKLALIRPVRTSTDGLCVARIRCIPAARAI